MAKIMNSALGIIILITLIISLVVLILIDAVASVCVIKAFFKMINEAKDE